MEDALSSINPCASDLGFNISTTAESDGSEVLHAAQHLRTAISDSHHAPAPPSLTLPPGTLLVGTALIDARTIADTTPTRTDPEAHENYIGPGESTSDDSVSEATLNWSDFVEMPDIRYQTDAVLSANDIELQDARVSNNTETHLPSGHVAGTEEKMPWDDDDFDTAFPFTNGYDAYLQMNLIEQTVRSVTNSFGAETQKPQGASFAASTETFGHTQIPENAQKELDDFLRERPMGGARTPEAPGTRDAAASHSISNDASHLPDAGQNVTSHPSLVTDRDAVDTEPEEDEEGYSLLDYARLRGLCKDYLADNPLDHVRQLTPPADLDISASDLQGMLDIETQAGIGAIAAGSFSERWHVDKDAAKFLALVIALSNQPEGNDMNDSSILTRKDLSLELPILRSDPELDMRRLRQRHDIILSSDGMEPFSINENADEGLAWSEKSRSLPAKVNGDIGRERLDVNEDVIRFLREAVIDTWTDKDEEKLIFGPYEAGKVGILVHGVSYRADLRLQRSAIRQVTPTLLPLSPPFSPKAPDSPAGHLDLTSTPEDPAVPELRRLEDLMVEMDMPDQPSHAVQAAHTPETGELSSPLKVFANSPSSSPGKRKWLQDLRLETPLTHQDPLQPPQKKAKTVSFLSDLHVYIPGQSSGNSSMDPIAVQKEMDAFVKDSIQPLAQPAVQELQNERLVAADTLLRVPIPHVNDGKPEPPWKLYSLKSSGRHRKGLLELDAQRTLLSVLKREVLKDDDRWGGISKLEHNLGWSAFTLRLGKVQLEDDIDDDSLALFRIEMSLDSPLDTDRLVWKPDGLRVLDINDDDDDELEPAVFEETGDEMLDKLGQTHHQEVAESHAVKVIVAHDQNQVSHRQQSLNRQLTDNPVSTAQERPRPTENEVPTPQEPGSCRLSMQALLLKRKAEIEATVKQSERLAKKPVMSVFRIDKANQNVLDTDHGELGGQKPPQQTAFDGFFADNSLTSFINLQGGAPKGILSLENARSVPSPVRQAPAPAAVSVPRQEEAQTRVAPKPILRSLPLPQMHHTTRPSTIVVSSAILAQRTLMRQIRKIYPDIVVCERDVATRVADYSKVGQGRPSGNSAEADFVLSPSTGLISTTLQKVKQKPLPGQASHFGLQERIAAVAIRYERLLVLVSEGSNSAPDAPCQVQALDERDSDALSSLMGLTTALETEVQVIYVPGGETELANWIAASASRYASSSQATLLQDETLWELFLRQAGMNVFAAQVVLAELKVPDPPTGSGGSSSVLQDHRPCSFGLAAFVKMSVQERIASFSAQLGGEKVLRRVSAVLDAGWMSVADPAVG